MSYVVAVAVAGLIGWLAYQLLYVRLRGIRTEAIITHVVEEYTGDGTFGYPVVTFRTREGASVTAQSKVGTEQAQSYFRPGSRVTIFYLATDPSRFIIRGYDAAELVFLLILASAVLLAVYMA